jgi:2-methylisocitrate lyase-like PEP mutase family enzyme
MRDLVADAETLRSLHVPGSPLVLPNAWDAASARAVETAGFPVVATSSAAVAAVLGFADGERTPPGEMFDAIARVAAAVTVPVTADIERGYGLPPAELIERLLAAGAVGCNLEDSTRGELVEPDAQAEFLHAVRVAATACGVPLVINARVDTFVRGTPDIEATVARSRRYLAAGADCVYPITAPVAAVADVVTATGGAVNALCPVGASRADLVAAGVARISYGGGLFRSISTALDDLLAKL